LTYPNDYAVNYKYELGALVGVADAAKTLATYSNFNAYGLHRKAVYGNGTVTDYTFDPISSRLQEIHVNQGRLLALQYSYDTVGNIAGIADNTIPSPAHPRALSEIYGYDQAGRLISATGPYGAKTYSYDAIGNFLTKEGVTYSYNDPQHPYAVTQGSDGFAATYDLNGNMVTKRDSLGDQYLYSFDEENQLTRVVIK
jgi:YD repeat-containing protein